MSPTRFPNGSQNNSGKILLSEEMGLQRIFALGTIQWE